MTKESGYSSLTNERKGERGCVLLEIDPDNIRDLRQEKKVHIHLTSDSKYVKKPREKERKRVCVREACPYHY